MGNLHGLVVASNIKEVKRIITKHKKAGVLGSVDDCISRYGMRDPTPINQLPKLVEYYRQEFFSILIEEFSIYKSYRYSLSGRQPVHSHQYIDIVERQLATYPQDTLVHLVFVHYCNLPAGIYNAPDA